MENVFLSVQCLDEFYCVHILKPNTIYLNNPKLLLGATNGSYIYNLLLSKIYTNNKAESNYKRIEEKSFFK